MLPSVTGIFDALGLTDFSMIDPARLEWKSGIGTAVHRGIELLSSETRLGHCPDEIIPAVVGVESWMSKCSMSRF